MSRGRPRGRRRNRGRASGDPTTAFLKACSKNKRGEVMSYLRRFPGALPSAWLTGEYGGSTALQYAGSNGDFELAQGVLESGAEVDKATPFGDTPLMFACDGNQLEVATLLLDYGADASVADIDGDTPLSVACSEGFEELATLLILRGAKYGQAIETNSDLPGSGRTYVRAQEAANATHIAEIAVRDAEIATLRAGLAESRGDAASSKVLSASDAVVARVEAADSFHHNSYYDLDLDLYGRREFGVENEYY